MNERRTILRLDEPPDAFLASKRGEQPWPEVNARRLRNECDARPIRHSHFMLRHSYRAWANAFLLKARRKIVEPENERE